jgi:hypothetical protein
LRQKVNFWWPHTSLILLQSGAVCPDVAFSLLVRRRLKARLATALSLLRQSGVPEVAPYSLTVAHDFGTPHHRSDIGSSISDFRLHPRDNVVQPLCSARPARWVATLAFIISSSAGLMYSLPPMPALLLAQEEIRPRTSPFAPAIWGGRTAPSGRRSIRAES